MTVPSVVNDADLGEISPVGWIPKEDLAYEDWEYAMQGFFLAHKSLTSITEELPKNRFLRIHRSFTVALDKIQAIEGNSVLLQKGKRIPIGRKYVNHAKDVILNA